jgi:uncharacterized membrane protein
MSETLAPPPIPPAQAPPGSVIADERQMALIIYILLLIPFSLGVTHIVGLVLAYVSRDTAPEWLKSHYTFQIRTFWLGLAYFALACLSVFILIGLALVPAVIVWYIVRCALGLNRLMRGEAYPNPRTWTI